jgi:hypothetical protein
MGDQYRVGGIVPNRPHTAFALGWCQAADYYGHADQVTRDVVSVVAHLLDVRRVCVPVGHIVDAVSTLHESVERTEIRRSLDAIVTAGVIDVCTCGVGYVIQRIFLPAELTEAQDQCGTTAVPGGGA